MTPTPSIIDLSHHNSVYSFESVKASGIIGVFHKATEGTTFTDEDYWARKGVAQAAGLEWASYHYLKHGSISTQMKSYLDFIKPVEGERVCIDFEDEKTTLTDLTSAVTYIMKHWPSLQITVYSGHWIKEWIDNSDEPDYKILSLTSLWIAQYGSSVSWPKDVWPYYSLWQYTDSGEVDGIDGDVDLNHFNGSASNAVKWMHPAQTEESPLVAEDKTVVVIVPKGVNVTIRAEDDADDNTAA